MKRTRESKKKLPIWAFLLSVLVTLTSFLTFFTGFRVYKKTFKTKPHDIRHKRLHERRLKTLAEYDHQTFMVESYKNGYALETIHIKSKIESSNAIILVHGIRSNYHELLSVAFRYLNDGYHVIMYNQRQSGKSGGENSTFGLYERFDLEEIAHVAKRLYPKGKIGVHGFSMGASTAIMQSQLNEQSNLIDFYILDAPFHTLESAIELAVKGKEGTRMPAWYVKFSGDAFLRLKERVAYKDIAPIEVIGQTTRPMLLIHGEKDEKTSADGSRALFGAITHNKRRLEIYPEEGHCTAAFKLEDDYFARIHSFLTEEVSIHS